MNSGESTQFRGAALIIAASLLWAGGYLFRKTILYGISPLLLTFLTSCIVTVVLSLAFRITPREVYKDFRAYPLHYVALALTGVVIGSTCMFVALDRLDLGTTVVLEKLQPVFTLLIASVVLNERISVSRIPFMLGAVVSSYFVSMKRPLDFTYSGVSLTGVGAVTLAACSWGVASVIGKRLTKLQPRTQSITLLRFLLGAVMLFPFFVFRGYFGLTMHLDPYVLGVATLCAVFSTGLGYLLFYEGLKGVSATTSGFLELVTPASGVVLGAVVLGERLTVSQLAGALMLLVSIYYLCRSKRPPQEFQRPRAVDYEA